MKNKTLISCQLFSEGEIEQLNKDFNSDLSMKEFFDETHNIVFLDIQTKLFSLGTTNDLIELVNDSSVRLIDCQSGIRFFCAIVSYVLDRDYYSLWYRYSPNEEPSYYWHKSRNPVDNLIKREKWKRLDLDELVNYFNL